MAHMQKYELLFIVHPDLEAEIQKIRSIINKKLQELKGRMIQENLWGIKGLAYPIKKQTQGIYVLCYFQIAEKSLGKFQAWLKRRESILRFLILKQEREKKPKLSQARARVKRQTIKAIQKKKIKLDEVLPLRPHSKQREEQRKVSLQEINRKIDELLENEEV